MSEMGSGMNATRHSLSMHRGVYKSVNIINGPLHVNYHNPPERLNYPGDFSSSLGA